MMSTRHISALHLILMLMLKEREKYILGGKELTLNYKGESVISYANYAVVMIDEATKGNHIKQRISVVPE